MVNKIVKKILKNILYKDISSGDKRYATIKRGKVKLAIASKQDVYLHTKKLPHTHITITKKGKIYKRY